MIPVAFAILPKFLTRSKSWKIGKIVIHGFHSSRNWQNMKSPWLSLRVYFLHHSPSPELLSEFSALVPYILAISVYFFSYSQKLIKSSFVEFLFGEIFTGNFFLEFCLWMMILSSMPLVIFQTQIGINGWSMWWSRAWPFEYFWQSLVINCPRLIQYVIY